MAGVAGPVWCCGPHVRAGVVAEKASVVLLSLYTDCCGQDHTDGRCGSAAGPVWCCGPIYGSVWSVWCFDGPGGSRYSDG